MIKDTKSIPRLKLLHPKVRDKAIVAYNTAVAITPVGVHPFITETLRTFERSDALYAQGRTRSGKIVTKARAGQSFHNYGLAIDFVIQLSNAKGDISFNWKIDNNWMKVVQCFKDVGFTWGGDFKTIPDSPHFEMTFGYRWQQLLNRFNEKDFIPGTNYVRL